MSNAGPTNIQVRGTDDPDDIAVVLAVLHRDGPSSAPRDGLVAWRERRRAALRGASRRRT
jgi:hypothetical protein